MLPNGALRIIDRKKNIFKLQQGEYVAPEKVEAVYLKRPEVAEMFLYGEPTQAFAVAVIAPEKAALEEIARKVGVTGSFEKLCSSPAVRKALLLEANEFGRREGLYGFEQPKNVFLEAQPFQTRGILTTTMKLQRFVANKIYQKEFAAMYKEGDILGSGKL